MCGGGRDTIFIEGKQNFSAVKLHFQCLFFLLVRAGCSDSKVMERDFFEHAEENRWTVRLLYLD